MELPKTQTTRGGEKVVVDEFVSKYMRENPNSTKTEALQEWNREKSRRTEYTAGFTGNSSLSNLPVDLRRNILNDVPGGRYSIVTTKQTNPNRVEISLTDLCYEPIGKEEFKEYALKQGREFLKDKLRYLSIRFIAKYGIIIQRYPISKREKFEKKYPALAQKIAELQRKYKSDKRFPVVTVISIHNPDLGEERGKEYFETNNLNPDLYAEIGLRDYGCFMREAYMKPIMTDVTRKIEGVLHYRKHNIMYVLKERLINVLDNILSNGGYHNPSDILLPPSTAYDILSERESCKHIDKDVLFDRSYKLDKIIRQILTPIPGIISLNDKITLLNIFTRGKSIYTNNKTGIKTAEIINEYKEKKFVDDDTIVKFRAEYNPQPDTDDETQ